MDERLTVEIEQLDTKLSKTNVNVYACVDMKKRSRKLVKELIEIINTRDSIIYKLDEGANEPNLVDELNESLNKLDTKILNKFLALNMFKQTHEIAYKWLVQNNLVEEQDVAALELDENCL